jgi:hypothetical protein
VKERSEAIYWIDKRLQIYRSGPEGTNYQEPGVSAAQPLFFLRVSVLVFGSLKFTIRNGLSSKTWMAKSEFVQVIYWKYRVR